MKEMFEEPTVPPCHGYISELAWQYNCSKTTITLALFESQIDEKSNLARIVYNKKYK
jgi:hypothetical protein